MFDDNELYELFYKFKYEPILNHIKKLYNYLIDKDYNKNIIIFNEALIHIKQGYETMKYLLDRGCDPNIKNMFGVSALHYQSDYNVVKLLVERGGNIHDEDIYSFTITHWQKDPEAIEYLIRLGAPIHNYNYIIYPKLFRMNNPFNIMLIQGGYDPYNELIISIPPLFLQRNYQTIKLMLDNLQDNMYDICNETPLFKSYVTPELIQLFYKYGYDINHQNNLGNTLLHVHYDIDIIKTILRYNIDLTLRNNLNNTAYRHHLKKGNIHICKIILEYYNSRLIQKNWRRFIFKKKYVPIKNYLYKKKFLNEFLYIPPNNIFPGGYEYQKALARFNENKNN